MVLGNYCTAKQQNNKITKQQNSIAAKQQNSKNSKTAKQRNSEQQGLWPTFRQSMQNYRMCVKDVILAKIYCDVENIVADSCENDGYEISREADNNRTILVDTSKENEDDYRLNGRQTTTMLEVGDLQAKT